MGAQKNRLIETVLLSTHNICFGWEIRKIFSCYTLLDKTTKTYGTFKQNCSFTLFILMDYPSALDVFGSIRYLRNLIILICVLVKTIADLFIFMPRFYIDYWMKPSQMCLHIPVP